MNRTDFLRWFFTAGAAIISGKYVLAGVPEKSRDIYLDSLYIAGFQYYDGPGLEKNLRESDPLILKREPKNPHDYFAVEVYRGDSKLGYLPRSDNRIIARIMDQGVRVKAVVRGVDFGGQIVKIRLYV